ncbi:hypothetical protein E2562_035484 [Oryza meyeriana var. granulata]|uniref:Uncharacterized protein n=1 Tax=Oryza meyeriana var. granulata TaxID=110450 RepID=A0A6G1CL29_9ORYZ|nr:hypothetical protein E2562_035484 [Oryza meyeriana var. granulata]
MGLQSTCNMDGRAALQEMKERKNEKYLDTDADADALLSCCRKRGDRRSNPIRSNRRKMNSPGGVNEWEDSPGEMDSEAASAVGMGMGMMEVDADDRHPPSSLPIDADFFNSFPDDFDDQDLA